MDAALAELSNENWEIRLGALLELAPDFPQLSSTKLDLVVTTALDLWLNEYDARMEIESVAPLLPDLKMLEQVAALDTDEYGREFNSLTQDLLYPMTFTPAAADLIVQLFITPLSGLGDVDADSAQQLLSRNLNVLDRTYPKIAKWITSEQLFMVQITLQNVAADHPTKSHHLEFSSLSLITRDLGPDAIGWGRYLNFAHDALYWQSWYSDFAVEGYRHLNRIPGIWNNELLGCGYDQVRLELLTTTCSHILQVLEDPMEAATWFIAEVINSLWFQLHGIRSLPDMRVFQRVSSTIIALLKFCQTIKSSNRDYEEEEYNRFRPVWEMSMLSEILIELFRLSTSESTNIALLNELVQSALKSDAPSIRLEASDMLAALLQRYPKYTKRAAKKLLAQDSGWNPTWGEVATPWPEAKYQSPKEIFLWFWDQAAELDSEDLERALDIVCTQAEQGGPAIREPGKTLIEETIKTAMKVRKIQNIVLTSPRDFADRNASIASLVAVL